MNVTLCSAQKHAALTYQGGMFEALVSTDEPVDLCTIRDKTFALLLAQIALDSEEEGFTEAFCPETRVAIAMRRLIANITIEMARRERKRHLH